MQGLDVIPEVSEAQIAGRTKQAPEPICGVAVVRAQVALGPRSANLAASAERFLKREERIKGHSELPQAEFSPPLHRLRRARVFVTVDPLANLASSLVAFFSSVEVVEGLEFVAG